MGRINIIGEERTRRKEVVACGVDNLYISKFALLQKTGVKPERNCPVHRCHLHYFIQRTDSRVKSPPFLHHSRSLHSLQHIQIVGRCASVRAYADLASCLNQFLVKEVVAGTQLQVGIDVMDTGNLVSAKYFHILVAEPESVCRNQVGPQNPYAFEVFHRAHSSVSGHTVLHFLPGFGKVDVQRETVSPGKFRSPYHHRLADGIRRVESHRKAQILRPFPGNIVHFPASGLFDFIFAVGHLVDDHVGRHRADSHFNGSPVSHKRKPIMVIESGGTGLYHFQTSHLRAPIDEFFVQVFFDFPDIGEPLMESGVFADAPHQ